MARSFFPKTEQEHDTALCGLKIITVKSSLSGAIEAFECEDDLGELHRIEFRKGVMILDGEDKYEMGVPGYWDIREMSNGSKL